MIQRISLCLIVLFILCSCAMKSVVVCEVENDRHVGVCEPIVNQAYLYALLSVNSYETAENTPVVLPEKIREVRHADSEVSDPSPEYVDSKVYDNGSFQAKVFEIWSGAPEDGADTLSEVVIAYRGTQKFPIADLIDGTITHNHRIKAVHLYEEIKNKYRGQDVIISLTGHSLGGALALEVVYSYLEDDIRAYVINPSYQLTLLKKYHRLPAERQVYSLEEILDQIAGPLRAIATNPKGLKIYKFDYEKNPLADGHSRFSMARGLLKEAKENGVEGAARIFNMNQKMYE